MGPVGAAVDVDATGPVAFASPAPTSWANAAAAACDYASESVGSPVDPVQADIPVPRASSRVFPLPGPSSASRQLCRFPG